jgi:RND family efflux transporter MFP subunit
MATQRPALGASFEAFAGQLLAEREVAPRARVIAAEASARLPGTAVVVYLFAAAADQRWTSKASVGDIKAPAQCEALTLAMLAEQREPLLFSGAELVREHYAHLDVRRTIASLAYVPLLSGETLLGAIEAVSLDRVLTRDDLAELGEMAALSSRAIVSALAYEDERNSNLDSITRLTQLYDVEKVFNSTLSMDELMPIITAKVRELLSSDAVNLWMVQGEDVLLMNQDGADPTVILESEADPIILQVVESGEPVVINGSGDERLAKRNSGVENGAAITLMAAPITEGDSLVGVLECVNKSDGTYFDEDDLFFLTTMSETASGALHNASLMEAEKKIEVLETLVKVSQEITSTLNLDRVLQVVVNGPRKMMYYDRACVALEQKGKWQVKAVSGMQEVVASDPVVRQLRDIVEFSAVSDKEMFVVGRPDHMEADREETRAKFREYFIETGMRTWYSVPLADDQGRLGMMAFESSNPDAFGETQFELIKVLASQATVAVRNASLYEEVPLRGILQPLLEKKQQFLRMEKSRRAGYVVLAVATLLFLVFFPLPMRVAGDASVAPQSSAKIQAEVAGVVRNVYVHEGDRVAKGTILADLNDWDYRATLAAAQAKLATALAAMNRSLAANDGTEAGIQQLQADYWRAEVARAGARLECTKLKSPIDGVVATPHVETLVGTNLDVGDTFGQVVNSGHALVDVALDESDVSLVQPGDYAAVKLESFPTEKFKGQVELVSPMSAAQEEKRVFFARVDVPNPQGLIRPGMQGMSKVSTGWKPAGFVLFRGLGMWAWGKIWNWFGW